MRTSEMPAKVEPEELVHGHWVLYPGKQSESSVHCPGCFEFSGVPRLERPLRRRAATLSIGPTVGSGIGVYAGSHRYFSSSCLLLSSLEWSDKKGYGPTDTVFRLPLPSQEKTRHLNWLQGLEHESQGQNLTSTFRRKVFRPFTLLPLRSEAGARWCSAPRGPCNGPNSAAIGLNDCPQVDILGFRYKSVKFSNRINLLVGGI